MTVRTTLGDPNAVAKVISTILSPGGALIGAELKPSEPDPGTTTFGKIFNSPSLFFFGALAAVGVGAVIVVKEMRRRTRRRR